MTCCIVEILSAVHLCSFFFCLIFLIYTSCNGFQREKKSINMGLIINLFLFAAIFSAISATRPRADVAYCIHALARRLSKTHNWAVGP